MRRPIMPRAALLRLLLPCTLLCILPGTGGAHGTENGAETMNVHASLSVDAKHDKVLVTFRAENLSERRAWLPRTVAADQALTGRLFDLREHPGGAEVAYTGPWVKRGPMTAADFVELAPHSAHTHTIDITDAYDFKPGQHSYEIRYEGGALPDVRQLDATRAIEAAPVVFSHTAPPGP